MGARPLNRVIDEKIKKPLADELIHGKLIKGGHVLVDAKDDILVFEINKIENAQKKSAELLEQFGLKDRLNHFPSQLSGGEQQRVAIARSIILSPKLILADEPSGNLDSENSKLIINLLFKYSKQNNSSLILVTHDQSIAKECDKIIEIKDGKII